MYAYSVDTFTHTHISLSFSVRFTIAKCNSLRLLLLFLSPVMFLSLSPSVSHPRQIDPIHCYTSTRLGLIFICVFVISMKWFDLIRVCTCVCVYALHVYRLFKSSGNAWGRKKISATFRFQRDKTRIWNFFKKIPFVNSAEKKDGKQKVKISQRNKIMMKEEEENRQNKRNKCELQPWQQQQWSFFGKDSDSSAICFTWTQIHTHTHTLCVLCTRK